mgnify:CR=1
METTDTITDLDRPRETDSFSNSLRGMETGIVDEGKGLHWAQTASLIPSGEWKPRDVYSYGCVCGSRQLL